MSFGEWLKSKGVSESQTRELGFASSLDREYPNKTRVLFHVPKKSAVQLREEPEKARLEGDAVYLCGNSLGLQPVALRTRLDEQLEKWKRMAVQGHFRGDTPWLRIDEVVLGPMARLVGAKEGEVAVMGSLSINLHTMMVPFYRPTQQRHKILIEKGSFPSDLYIATSQIQFHGFNPSTSLIEVSADEGEFNISTQKIISIINQNKDSLAMVFLPGIQYSTGQYLDMKAITEAAHRVGAVAGWDCAHAVGNVKMQLHDWGVDFACWCTYKYLNSGPGGIGGLFIHEKHATNNFPRFAAWWGHDLTTRFNMDKPFKAIPGAFGYRHSNPSVLTISALRSSLDIFDSVGIDALVERQRKLTGYLEYLIDQKLQGLVSVITPRNVEARGCQLSLLMNVNASAKEVEEELAQEGVVVDARGKVIRVAPTPLYNTFEDVYVVVEVLGRLLRKAKAKL